MYVATRLLDTCKCGIYLYNVHVYVLVHKQSVEYPLCASKCKVKGGNSGHSRDKDNSGHSRVSGVTLPGVTLMSEVTPIYLMYKFILHVHIKSAGRSGKYALYHHTSRTSTPF